MSKYIGELNPQKLAKVNERADTVKPSKYDKAQVKETPAPSIKAAPAGFGDGPPKKKPVKKKAPVIKKPVPAAEEMVIDDP
jgi:hypothetical protein